MKFRFISITVVLALCQFSFAQKDDFLNVATFNIRYANPDDGPNVWDNRKDWVCQSMDFFDVDVFGAQEVIASQLADMAQRLPGYDYVGIGRNGGTEGEFCPVFYKKASFELMEDGTFWLSETPEKANSQGWDAALPRIVTWVRLKVKSTGKEFYVFNTHFDHRGKTAQLESAKLLKQRINTIAGDLPFVVMGDFNFSPSFKAYSILTEKRNPSGVAINDTKGIADQEYGPSYTFNGFALEPDQNRERIDYVFCSDKVSVHKHHTLDGQRGEYYVSDHFPIIVCLSF